MGFNLSYMGTKKQLAPLVAQVINDARPGIFLDAFSGMCAVSSEVGDNRKIWNNDVQVFSATVAKALFTSKDLPIPMTMASDILYKNYERHFNQLHASNSTRLKIEDTLFASEDIQRMVDYLTFPASKKQASAGIKKAPVKLEKGGVSHDLFTNLYANAYFSLRQCIEIDSILEIQFS